MKTKILISVLVLIFVFSGCIENNPEPVSELVTFDEFGIKLNNVIVVVDSVKSSETISTIFSNANLNSLTINKILDSSKNFYDLSKLKAGNKYYSYFSDESDSSLLYFIYEINPLEYCFVDLTNRINIQKKERESVVIERTAYGKISSSLYQTLSDANINAELAIKLAEIFAWEIDFYRLQKDDYFKVIYEEMYVGGKFVGIKKILSTQFFHDGEDFFAFAFNQDDELQYFNEDGKSLRKQFLQSPLKFSRISSGFSLKRFHPVQKRFKAHLGTDYAAPTGTPILAVGAGVVIEAAYKQFNGNYVKIKHNSTYTTQYLHMSNFAKGIRRGVHVSQGEVIGYVGSTGLATGPHVCFRFWKNNKQVDHRKEKFPPSYPVANEKMEEFNKIRDFYLSKMMDINIDSVPVQLAYK